jgi:hypothetical protein
VRYRRSFVLFLCVASFYHLRLIDASWTCLLIISSFSVLPFLLPLAMRLSLVLFCNILCVDDGPVRKSWSS